MKSVKKLVRIKERFTQQWPLSCCYQQLLSFEVLYLQKHAFGKTWSNFFYFNKLLLVWGRINISKNQFSSVQLNLDKAKFRYNEVNFSLS